ncbi:MAG: hypothetical protein PHY95_00755 [Candidatus ainarchaeum sp.]|nr:hypothetical protein [Candidatus ainarchaeum sp.]
MKLRFDADALQWMGSHGFGVEDVSEVAEYLGVMRRSVAEGRKFLVPKRANEKVSALIAILYALTDISGMPACFRDGEVVIPAEAKKRFKEALAISREEKEGTDEQFGSGVSKAKRRSGLRGRKGR